MQSNSIRLVKTIGISSAPGLTGVLLQMHLLQFLYDADIPLYSWPIETLLAYHKVLSFPWCPTSVLHKIQFTTLSLKIRKYSCTSIPIYIIISWLLMYLNIGVERVVMGTLPIGRLGRNLPDIIWQYGNWTLAAWHRFFFFLMNLSK